MNGSRIADEFLAEECGVDYDEVTSDQNNLCQEDFEDLYECAHCNAVHPLVKFEDTEHDGDVIGTCPTCKVNCILFPVS